MSSDQDKWDQIYSEPVAQPASPCYVLAENAHLLPRGGRALDLASGRGGNALFLAKLGLQVEAWDISAVATDLLNRQASKEDLSVRAKQVDVVTMPPAANSCEVLVVSQFLERSLFPKIRNAVMVGGLVIYQTYTEDRQEGGAGPSNPDYLLQQGELLQMFAGWQILVYREDALVGDQQQGWRGMAGIVARKPV